MFLGAPGSGKGTQSEFVAQKYNIPTISTGTIIRKSIKSGTKTGKLAESYVSKGELIPDNIICGMLLERLAESDCNNGYILDGFPRNITQAQALVEAGIEPDIVVNIEADDEMIVNRLGGRRVCPNCEASYHVSDNAPQKDGICDKCGTELITRIDDKPEVILKRLKVYHAQTEPLIDFYGKKNKLMNVVSQKTVAGTAKLISDGLEKLIET